MDVRSAFDPRLMLGDHILYYHIRHVLAEGVPLTVEAMDLCFCRVGKGDGEVRACACVQGRCGGCALWPQQRTVEKTSWYILIVPSLHPMAT